jgi:energy-coupling factor transport system permease protein
MATMASGLFQPGTSFVHTVDPRLKTLACLALVVLVFAASGWLSLLLAAAAILVCWRLSGLSSALPCQLAWMMRWLLLFTLSLHLLLTPGRTLAGVAWLSYDGLLGGLHVCAQMLLALFAASLLAATTSTGALASTFGWSVRPLRRCGCPTDDWQRMLELALGFLPVVHAEFRTSAGALNPDDGRQGRARRWQEWNERLQGMMQRLADRAESVARQLAAEGWEDPPQSLPALLPMTVNDRLFALVALLVVVAAWATG